jgi:hypothetical protein
MIVYCRWCPENKATNYWFQQYIGILALLSSGLVRSHRRRAGEVLQGNAHTR